MLTYGVPNDFTIVNLFWQITWFILPINAWQCFFLVQSVFSGVLYIKMTLNSNTTDKTKSIVQDWPLSPYIGWMSTVYLMGTCIVVDKIAHNLVPGKKRTKKQQNQSTSQCEETNTVHTE